MLTQLLDVFSFVSVLLRGAALISQSLIVGGALFSLFVLRPLQAQNGPHVRRIVQSGTRLLLWSSVAFACVQTGYMAANSVLLTGTTGLGWAEVAGAGFFVFGAVGAIAALIVAGMVTRREWTLKASLVLPSLVIVGTLIGTSHAAGRVDARGIASVLGAIHVLAAASWIGGLPYLLMALARAQEFEVQRWLCRRFSALAAVSVAMLAAAGLMLSLIYIDSGQALYGTAYGAMVMSKAVLLGVVLTLGALNFLLVRRMAAAAGEELILKLRRFGEAEVGIGFTVILAAASLSSQPPAVDLSADRLSAGEIVARMAPRWPKLTTPPVSSLSPATPLAFHDRGSASALPVSYVPGTSYQPNTPSDIAWSEYNHHWAGIVVFAVGLLALAARWPALDWARHWPLAFLGLAVFLFLRADPENWPLGPRGFWESFTVAEVLQHRLFVLLIVLFAVFEWGVVTGRIASRRFALVFPGVCAAGGALLLTHAHPLGNVKQELLAELSHLPLAICAVIAGWSRWLELRLPGDRRHILTWVWPVCFILIGLILLNYRES